MNIQWQNEKELTRHSARRYGVCLCLMLEICSVCPAQKLDIKPYILYHQSVSTYEEQPVFYENHVHVPLPVDGFPKTSTSSYSKDFTLATGLEYGLAINYTFHNQLGIELGLGYFSSQSNSFVNKPGIAPYLTGWNYYSIAVRPLFSYVVMKGKSSFIGKIGPSIYYASAIMDAFLSYVDEPVSTCTFDNRLNWGYSIGLEYNYQFSKQFSLAIELGFEQYKYTPNKATVEQLVSGGKKYEIHYVNEIFSEPVSQYPLQEKRLKESILFNNIFWGIGIKYNLWKK